MWAAIPKFFKTFYFLVAFFFLIWMIFFDPNDFISQYKMRSKLKEIEGEKAYYKEKIIEVTNKKAEKLILSLGYPGVVAIVDAQNGCYQQ